MDLPDSLRHAIDELLELKKRTTEGEENPQMPVIREFIKSETTMRKEIADNLDDDHNRDWTALSAEKSQRGKKRIGKRLQKCYNICSRF